MPAGDSRKSATAELDGARHAEVPIGFAWDDVAIAATRPATGNRRGKALIEGVELTEREQDVMRLVVMGLPNKLIADQLDISVRTVETHRLSLRRKLGVDSASDLLKIAVSNGWTTL